MSRGATGPGDSRPLAGADWLALAALAGAAALLRSIAWLRTGAISNDGPRYLDMARAVADGEWSAVFAESYHPLYAVAVAAARWTGFDWEAAGGLVSVVAGSLAVGFLYLLLRAAFGAPYDWIGALLLAVHSRAIEVGADVQSDALYLACFLAAAWLGWRALESRSAARAFGCGLAAGLGYLTRPEGLGVALVIGGLGLLRLAVERCGALRFARWSAALALGSALCVGPYAIALHEVTGVWSLTQKKSVMELLGAAEPRHGHAAFGPVRHPLPAEPFASGPDRRAAAPEGGRSLAAGARDLARTAGSATRYATLALLALGLFAARGRPGPRARFFGALVVGYAVVLLALSVSYGYVSRRHVLPLVALGLGYAALGVPLLGRFVLRSLHRPVAGGRAAAAGAAVAVGMMLPNQLAANRADELAERRAAEWLRENAPPGPVAAERERIGYYAGMPYIPLRRVPDAELGRYLAWSGARYAIVDEPEPAGALAADRDHPVRMLHRVRAGGVEAWVFERLVAGPGAGDG